jgi:hypothetical protein
MVNRPVIWMAAGDVRHAEDLVEAGAIHPPWT